MPNLTFEKEKLLINSNEMDKNYISLIKTKNVSLINKLKCKKRNLTKSINNSNDYTYEIRKISDKTETNRIKNINIIKFNNKKLIFFLSDNDFLIYEINENPFFLEFKKSIPQKEFFSDNIKYYYVFLYEDKIVFNFFNFRQIKLYSFDFIKNEFNLKRSKNYSKDISNKYFYYLKRNNKFIIFNCDEANIYDSILSNNKTLISQEDDLTTDSIVSCKELNNTFLCFIFSNSISFYDLISEKFIGTINEIISKSVKLIENKYIIILTLLGDINIYDIENISFIRKIDVNKLKNISKIKQLLNFDIGIIYGDNNLAIYDLNKNIIKYQIKNDNKNYFNNKKYYLKHIQTNIIMYNPTRYCLHIMDYIKGEVIAKFNDGLNRILKCKKIDIININDDYKDEIIKEKIYIIINLKGYFLFKIGNI